MDEKNIFDYNEVIHDRNLFDSLRTGNIEPKDIYSTLNLLKLVCEMKKIPFFGCIATSNNEDKTEYYSVTNSPEIMNMELKDDKISQMLLIMAGMKVNKMGKDELDEEEMDDSDFKDAKVYFEEEME